jgi:hypothetical protein
MTVDCDNYRTCKSCLNSRLKRIAPHVLCIHYIDKLAEINILCLGLYSNLPKIKLYPRLTL